MVIRVLVHAGPAELARDNELHILRDILQSMEAKRRQPAPPLLPIFRSQQQAELLADVLEDPEREQSVTELVTRLGVPFASAHRELGRAESVGLVVSRRVGRTRLFRANTKSPYYAPLAELLARSFGVPRVLTSAIGNVDGTDEAYIFGSWAARWAGEEGTRPVADIDLLVIGEPERDALYDAIEDARRRLGREIQVTIREPGWLENGDGTFHDTVVSRPMLRLDEHAGWQLVSPPRRQSARSTKRQASRA